MAVTVGATIQSGASGLPPRGPIGGPYISSAGNVYSLGIPTATTLAVYKSTSPIAGSFAEQNSAGRPTTLSGSGVGSCQVGDTIWTVYYASLTSFRAKPFNMSTDTWGTEQTVSTITNAIADTNQTYCSVVGRSDGSLVAYFLDGVAGSMSSIYLAGYRKRSAAGTWDGTTTLVGANTLNWSSPNAVLGASDRVHFFMRDANNADLYVRTLSAANVMDTNTAVDTSVSTAVSNVVGPGTSYVSGATKVRAPYADATTNTTSIAGLDSADAPTYSVISTGASGATPLSADFQYPQQLVADGTTLYLLYVKSTDSDLYIRSSTDNGTTFGTDSDEWVGTITQMTANVLTRAGNRVIAIAAEDAGTIKYAEYALSAAPPAAAPVHRRLVRRAALVRRNRY